MENFTTTTKYFSFINEDLIASLTDKYGFLMEDDDEKLQSLVAYWDDTNHTKKRAAVLGRNLEVIELENGNKGVQGFFSKSFMAALPIAGVVEITKPQFETLTPDPNLTSEDIIALQEENSI